MSLSRTYLEKYFGEEACLAHIVCPISMLYHVVRVLTETIKRNNIVLFYLVLVDWDHCVANMLSEER